MDIYHANPGSCPFSNVLRMLKLVAVDGGYLFNYFLRQGDNVFTSLVCLFVSRITQKLRNRFSQNSVERGHTGRGRNR